MTFKVAVDVTVKGTLKDLIISDIYCDRNNFISKMVKQSKSCPWLPSLTNSPEGKKSGMDQNVKIQELPTTRQF